MLRSSPVRFLFLFAALSAVLAPVQVFAQDDANEIPLGDVARNLRKKNAPAQQVIDDDNLNQVMQQADSRKAIGSSLRYLMSGDSKGFAVSAPDVTCSLSFTANVKALLSSQYSQMDLPVEELAKLEGPATIEGDALTVTILNGTNWHLSEIAVALTTVKKGVPLEGLQIDETGTDPASISAIQQVRPEKKQDVTVIYRMRAPAPPWERAVFSAPLKIDLAPEDEWHWAIVEARGYPPQKLAGAEVSGSNPRPVIQPAVAIPVATRETAQQSQDQK